MHQSKSCKFRMSERHVMFRHNWLNIANSINRYCIINSKWYYASIPEILDWQIPITAKIATKAATSDGALVGTFPWEYLHFVRLFQWFAQSYCGEPWLQIAGEPPRSSGSHLLSLSCQTHKTGPARTSYACWKWWCCKSKFMNIHITLILSIFKTEKFTS